MSTIPCFAGKTFFARSFSRSFWVIAYWRFRITMPILSWLHSLIDCFEPRNEDTTFGHSSAALCGRVPSGKCQIGYVRWTRSTSWYPTSSLRDEAGNTNKRLSVVVVVFDDFCISHGIKHLKFASCSSCSNDSAGNVVKIVNFAFRMLSNDHRLKQHTTEYELNQMTWTWLKFLCWNIIFWQPWS